jgi:hypothetical protein
MSLSLSARMRGGCRSRSPAARGEAAGPGVAADTIDAPGTVVASDTIDAPGTVVAADTSAAPGTTRVPAIG